MYYHKIFKNFCTELEKDWTSLEDNQVAIFSCYNFHYSLNQYIKKNRNQLYIYVIYEKETNKSISILPLEKKRSIFGDIYTIHKFQYLDHIQLIYSRNTNINCLAEYIVKNIFKGKELFISAISSKDKLINLIDKKCFRSFKWINNNRYTIPNNELDKFFITHKRMTQRVKRSKRKYKLNIETVEANYEKACKAIQVHIDFKVKQFKRTFTRNAFSNKEYINFIYGFIRKNPKGSLVLTLNSENSNIEAVLICFISSSEICYYQPSYDIKSKVDSPGKVLMEEAIQYAYKINKTFDFSTGDESYKKQYSKNRILLHSYYFSENRFLNLIHFAKYIILYQKNSRSLLRKIYRYIKIINSIEINFVKNLFLH